MREVKLLKRMARKMHRLANESRFDVMAKILETASSSAMPPVMALGLARYTYAFRDTIPWHYYRNRLLADMAERLGPVKARREMEGLL